MTLFSVKQQDRRWRGEFFRHLLLLLVLLSSHLKVEAQEPTFCQQLCEHVDPNNVFESQGNYAALHAGCNCCYEKDLEHEWFTARNWYDVMASQPLPKPFTLDRVGWYLNRTAFYPIAGDTTLVAGVLYTMTRSILKMTVVFPPLWPEESRRATVTLWGHFSGQTYQWSAPCEIQEHVWYCRARMEGLPTQYSHATYRFRVDYAPNPDLPNLVYTYEGSVPKQVDVPKIACLGCFGRDKTKDKTKFVQAVLATEPDLLVLQGDQTYFHNNLGYGFLEFVYTVQDLTRQFPTIVQMDDHDYGEPNLWGAGENPAADDTGEGFFKSACVMNHMQDFMMGHNPDSQSDRQLQNGITIHYTTYHYGLVDFALIESRKFKHLQYGDSLLGSDQEAWLRQWCTDQDRPAKVILSQTPFANLATNQTDYNADTGLVPIDTENTDSNGYPVQGRRRFLEIVKDCSPLILSGDQHLGIAVQYPDYNDILECASPAVINDVWWRVNIRPENQVYHDEFGNAYKLLKAWNVQDSVWKGSKTPFNSRKQNDWIQRGRADGFLMVDLNIQDDKLQASTCQMHSYRTVHEIIWQVTVDHHPSGGTAPAPSPPASHSFCRRQCLIYQGHEDICDTADGCVECDPFAACPALCARCGRSDKTQYGGLTCEC